MTDEQIIKGSECCADESVEMCNECPYFVDKFTCNQMQMRKDALELIKRYKTKCEQLDETIQNLDVLLRTNDKDYRKLLAENKELEAEIERRKNNLFCKVVIDEEKMKNIVTEKMQEFEIDINTIRAEAIKEFAERIKAEFNNVVKYEFDCRYYYLVSHSFIDKLVKEMVGDKK